MGFAADYHAPSGLGFPSVHRVIASASLRSGARFRRHHDHVVRAISGGLALHLDVAPIEPIAIVTPRLFILGSPRFQGVSEHLFNSSELLGARGLFGGSRLLSLLSEPSPHSCGAWLRITMASRL